MAFLLPVTAGSSVKLCPEFKRLSASPPVEKRSYTSGDWDKGFETSNLGVRGGFPLEGNRKRFPYDFLPLLRECMEKKSVSGVESVHARIIKTGFAHELFLATFLLNVCCKNGMMENAHKLFDELPTRNIVTWTSLLSGCVQNSQPRSGLEVFKEMLEAASYPTNYTFGIVLKACSSLSDIETGKQIHGYIVKSGYEHDASTGNALCSFYSKCQKLDMAIQAFQRIKEKDVISWTAAISACGENGNEAKGLEFFLHMLDQGVQPNEISLTSIISLCCATNALHLGYQVQSLCFKLGYGSDLPVANSFMYLYLTHGRISDAKKLFYGMKMVTVVAWNALIAGHAEITSNVEDSVSAYTCGIEALKMFQQMNKSGLRPDSYTFSSVLTICSNVVALEQGEQIHAQAIKTGFLSDVVLSTSLLNMYSKCGSIQRASKAFAEMPTRTLVSWTSMISALAHHGYLQQTLDIFEDMRCLGIRPNKITFVGVLSACSQAGRVDLGLSYYDMMTDKYKINPVIDHVACLVHMFVRLGQVEEAFNLIKKANVVPNEFVWSILVAGCRAHEKLDLGFYAADKLLELKPRDPETYSVLLNIYISAGKWKDVSRVRKMMKDERIDKRTDWSWITIRNEVHSFKDTSKRHQCIEAAAILLDDLLVRSRAHGYQSQTCSEIAEDEKGNEAVAFPAHHSEKLAVAFGLLKTPEGADILIIKSIGMCRDCHAFMKAVSLLASRSIIVRDSKRLHKFSRGQCSCGDSGALV